MLGDLRHAGVGRRGINGLRLVPLEPEHHGARSPVPCARGTEGTEEFDPQPRDLVQKSVGGQPGDETSCRAHRSDRVGARRPDADGEQIEHRDSHDGGRRRYGLGVTSTLGGSGDGSGCDERRMIENATAPPASTATPMPASSSGRRRRATAARLVERSGRLATDLRGFLRRRELRRDRVLRRGQIGLQLLGNPPAAVAVADPCRRGPHRVGPDADVPRVTSTGPTAEYFRPRPSRWPGSIGPRSWNSYPTSFGRTDVAPPACHLRDDKVPGWAADPGGRLASRDESHSDSDRDPAHQPRRHQDRPLRKPRPQDGRELRRTGAGHQGLQHRERLGRHRRARSTTARSSTASSTDS